jgi:hypothetical protein
MVVEKAVTGMSSPILILKPSVFRDTPPQTKPSFQSRRGQPVDQFCVKR